MKPTKLPSGAWRCLVYLGKDADGKRKYKSITRLDRKECMRDAAEVAIHHKEISRDTSLMTLGEAIDAYIEMKYNVLSPSTIKAYDSIRRNRLQPEMGIQLKSFTNIIAQRAINREAETLSPKTIRNIYGLLTAVMKQFGGPNITVTLPQKRPYEGTVLTRSQLETLIGALEGQAVEIPILLAICLGLRRSEILALTHDDFDEEQNIITIDKAKVFNKDGKLVEKTTKTVTSTRKLSVPAPLAEKLKACKYNGVPFCRVAPSNINNRLHKICEKAGLPPVRLHDLRHQNASIMLALGVADKYAMERGGWSSNRTMKNIYQHTLSDEKQLVDATIDAYFSDIISKKIT